MRLFSCRTTALALVVLLAACNTVDPSECWPNTSGGFGGSGSIPIGAGVGVSSGDFSSPPQSGPQDFGGGANPCVIAPTSCDAQCLANYEAAAAECGKSESVTERQSCQDIAYAVYRSCGGTCQQSNPCRKDCENKAEACESGCRQLPKDDKAGRQKCWVACNDAFAKCIKNCKD
jgi:hypothetical protein